MNPTVRQFCCVILLCLTILATDAIAKPGKFVGSTPPVDFSELDKLITEELKEKNTPGAVITVMSVKFDGKEHPLTKTGERKFIFGEQNENEIVFVRGKSGKIGFLFTELYGAKKIK